MQTINMLGQPCPIPVIQAKKALAQSAPGDTVLVLVDNDIARQNLQKMAEGLGHGFAWQQPEEGRFEITLTAGAKRDAAGAEGGLVVAIGRRRMGAGSDELGEALMKSYIYALTELDTPPEHLLFFNGGVHLACQGAATLADLTTLAQKGTQIAACGACLAHFGLTEQLAVGSVTNMYAISATMAAAARLINL